MKPEEEKARQRAAELEKLKQSLFISNKSTDPRLVVTSAVQPTVSLMAPVSPLQEHPEARGVGEEYPEQLIEPASVRPAVESPVPGSSRFSCNNIR
jgi:hypothetical protein